MAAQTVGTAIGCSIAPSKDYGGGYLGQGRRRYPEVFGGAMLFCAIWGGHFDGPKAGVVRVQRIAALLPAFIVLAFPVLYYGGHSENELLPAVGIVLLLLGMSGPIIRRYTRK